MLTSFIVRLRLRFKGLGRIGNRIDADTLKLKALGLLSMKLQLFENNLHLLNFVVPEGLESAGVHQKPQEILNEKHNVTKILLTNQYLTNSQVQFPFPAAEMCKRAQVCFLLRQYRSIQRTECGHPNLECQFKLISSQKLI